MMTPPLPVLDEKALEAAKNAYNDAVQMLRRDRLTLTRQRFVEKYHVAFVSVDDHDIGSKAAIRTYLVASLPPSSTEVTETMASADAGEVVAVEEAASRQGQWYAFNEVLGYLNTLDTKVVAKKDVYAAVVAMRPVPNDTVASELADFEAITRQRNDVLRALEASEAKVAGLVKERDEAVRLLREAVGAMDDMRTGISIHNDRKIDRHVPIEGAVVSALGAAHHHARMFLEALK